MNEKQKLIEKICAKKFIAEELLCEKKLYEYLILAWTYADPTPFSHAWHIAAICEHLEYLEKRQIKKLAISLPPGYAKSITCSVIFPSWVWLRNPKVRMLIGSHRDELVLRDALRCRRIITSEWYQSHWGNLYQLDEDQKAKSNYANTERGYRQSFTTLSGITGFRFDIGIFDDPIDFLSVGSKKKRETVNSVISSSVTTRQNVGAELPSVMAIIAQRLSINDPIAHITERDPDVVHLVLPSEYDPAFQNRTKYFTDPRKEKGEILWDKITAEDLAEKKRDLGSEQYQIQYLQRPPIKEGKLFKREWWEWYETGKLPPHCTIIQGWDCANKIGEENDYSVCLTIAKVVNKYYILNVFRKRLEYVDLKRAFVEQGDKYKPVRIYVEDAVNGTALISDLSTTKYGRIVIAVKPTQKKEERARPCTAVVEARDVLLPDDAEWTESFIDEFASFPECEHDDQVDTFTMIINKERTKQSSPRIIMF
jgi:predicted phage terminase large subunit-like protein